MQSLNEKVWEAKSITKIFSNVKPGKISNASAFGKSDSAGVEYIAATNRNNGCRYFLESSEELLKKMQTGNCIGFIKDGDGSAGYAIYKKESFVSTVNVLYGYADWLNEATGLFFVAAQDKIKPKYSHGYKRNKKHLAGDKVMLPIDDAGEPDYEYMSEYTRQKRESMLEKYREYAEARVAELGDIVNVPALDEKEWHKFKVFGDDEIMDIDTTNSSIDAIRLIGETDSDLPYVTRTDSNNGISRFVSTKNMSYGFDKAGTITVGLDTQTAFWQSHDFVTGQNIQVISGTILNEHIAQFLIPLLRKQMQAKFNWGGNGATLKRMRTLEIMLPVNDAGEPDYAYMEQYAKNMMLRKYKQYLSFLDYKEER